MFKIRGLVDIPQCGLYAKNNHALKTLFRKLKEMGYEIKDCCLSLAKDKGLSHGEARRRFQKIPCGLWYAHLGEKVLQRKGKCKSCGSYIDVRGIESHKHRCEVCGNYTYLKFVDGSVVRFNFISEKTMAFDPTLRMKVFDYDDELGCLLFYPAPEDGNNFNDLGADKAMEVLAVNKDKFTHVERAGKDFLAIRYNPYSTYVEPDAVISICEIWGHKWNHEIVRLYQGKEYDDYGDLPIPESYSIYEAWHWAPLKPSPKLHEEIIHSAGMVSRCDYYYQDGRPAFYDIHFERMHLFVEHFTNLPIDLWDQMIALAPKDGPGMIQSIAAFCTFFTGVKAVVTNAPNFGNILVGAGKMLEGKGLTVNEIKAMVDAINDPEESKKFPTDFQRKVAEKILDLRHPYRHN